MLKAANLLRRVKYGERGGWIIDTAYRESIRPINDPPSSLGSGYGMAKMADRIDDPPSFIRYLSQSSDDSSETCKHLLAGSMTHPTRVLRTRRGRWVATHHFLGKSSVARSTLPQAAS